MGRMRRMGRGGTRHASRVRRGARAPRRGRGHGTHGTDETDGTGRHASRVTRHASEEGRGRRAGAGGHHASEDGRGLCFLPFTDYESRIPDSASRVRRGAWAPRRGRGHGTHGTDETDGTGRHASRVMPHASAEGRGRRAGAAGYHASEEGPGLLLLPLYGLRITDSGFPLTRQKRGVGAAPGPGAWDAWDG